MKRGRKGRTCVVCHEGASETRRLVTEVYGFSVCSVCASALTMLPTTDLGTPQDPTIGYVPQDLTTEHVQVVHAPIYCTGEAAPIPGLRRLSVVFLLIFVVSAGVLAFLTRQPLSPLAWSSWAGGLVTATTLTYGIWVLQLQQNLRRNRAEHMSF